MQILTRSTQAVIARIEFNNGLGNANVGSGRYAAADTIIHELLHVASMIYGQFAVPLGWSEGDGGGDVDSERAQAWNQWLTANGCHFN